MSNSNKSNKQESASLNNSAKQDSSLDVLNTASEHFTMKQHGSTVLIVVLCVALCVVTYLYAKSEKMLPKFLS